MRVGLKSLIGQNIDSFRNFDKKIIQVMILALLCFSFFLNMPGFNPKLYRISEKEQ